MDRTRQKASMNQVRHIKHTCDARKLRGGSEEERNDDRRDLVLRGEEDRENCVVSSSIRLPRPPSPLRHTLGTRLIATSEPIVVSRY